MKMRESRKHRDYWARESSETIKSDENESVTTNNNKSFQLDSK